MSVEPEWPLSAVATELLLRRPVPRGRALSLTLKELVVCGTWRLRGETVPGRLWGTRRVPVLAVGNAPVPDRPPLRLFDAALRRLVREPRQLSEVVRPLQADATLAAQVLEQARADLLGRGLLRTEKRLLRTAVSRTPEGDAWCGRLAARRHAWEQALQVGGPAADTALAELSLAPGLVPLLDARALRDVDRAVRRRTPGVEGLGGSDDGVRWGELCDVDGCGFGGLDDAFGSVDGGSGFDSSGDAGGDSGGD